MRGAPKSNKNARGNRGGRSYPNSAILKFWKELDNLYLPEAGAFCMKVLKRANKHPNDKEWVSLGIRASQVLFSKAPERVTGGDGEHIIFKIITTK